MNTERAQASLGCKIMKRRVHDGKFKIKAGGV